MLWNTDPEPLIGTPISMVSDCVFTKSASPACRWRVSASGQSSPGMIHSMPSATQRQQTLPVAAADRGEEVLHGLDVLLGTHRNFSNSLGSDRARSDRARRVPAGGDVVFIRRT